MHNFVLYLDDGAPSHGFLVVWLYCPLLVTTCNAVLSGPQSCKYFATRIRTAVPHNYIQTCSLFPWRWRLFIPADKRCFGCICNILSVLSFRPGSLASLQLEREGVHPRSTHRRRVHAVHGGNGRQEKCPAQAALRTPPHVVRRRRAHDVPGLRRPRGRDCKLHIFIFDR